MTEYPLKKQRRRFDFITNVLKKQAKENAQPTVKRKGVKHTEEAKKKIRDAVNRKVAIKKSGK